MLHLDLAALGVEREHTPTTPSFAAHDLLTGATYAWGEEAFVRLDPAVQCAHIIEVRSL
jgi:starch synthase (maltosyl-transferring)